MPDAQMVTQVERVVLLLKNQIGRAAIQEQYRDGASYNRAARSWRGKFLASTSRSTVPPSTIPPPEKLSPHPAGSQNMHLVTSDSLGGFRPWFETAARLPDPPTHPEVPPPHLGTARAAVQASGLVSSIVISTPAS